MDDDKISYEYPDEILSTGDFNRLSSFIESQIGIKMPVTKNRMLEARLRKRLKNLKMSSYTRYCDYLFSREGMEKELEHFINAITTNKTDFFRESDHFEFLVRRAVPELIASSGAGVKTPLHLWSAACSRGNEAYTMAIVLNEFAENFPGLNFDYSILGTDISTRVLEIAQRAVYSHEEIEPVAHELREKYFLRSRDRAKNLVRVTSAIREKARFRQLNLMDNDFRLRESMDIIFCRNVIIYFDKRTQDTLIGKLCRNLKKNGYLFMGHSEVLDCHSLPLASVATAV